MLEKIIGKILAIHVRYIKSKWSIKRYFKSSVGFVIILILLSLVGVFLNVKYLSTDTSFKSTAYNIISSLLIGIISSSIITLNVEYNNIKNTKQKRLSVLNKLNFELCMFHNTYTLYSAHNDRYPNGHPLLENNQHLCDKYVFLNFVVKECSKVFAEEKDYLNTIEIDTLSCILTNYHCMEMVIGIDLLSMFDFDPMQHQLKDTTYDELLDDVAKVAIPELFNDIIKDLENLKLELELEGIQDVSDKGILNKYQKNC